MVSLDEYGTDLVGVVLHLELAQPRALLGRGFAPVATNRQGSHALEVDIGHDGFVDEGRQLVDVAAAQEVIKQKFGSLQPKLDTSRVLAESGEYPPISMQGVSRHFPPVVHRWSCDQAEAARLIPAPLIAPALPPQG